MTDLKVDAPCMPFEFRRYHNYGFQFMGPMGGGWSHSYHWPLQVQPNGNVKVLLPQLVPIEFALQSDGTFVPTTSAYGYELTTAPDGLFHMRHGRMHYDYSATRQLVAIRDHDGHVTSLAYDPVTTDVLWGSLLTQITDSVGRTYTVSWVAVPPEMLMHGGIPPDNYHGLVSLTQDATGRKISYFDGISENGMGTMSIAVVHDSAYPPNEVFTYGYDGYRPQSVTDRSGRQVLAATYDESRRVSTFQSRGEPPVSYSFSSAPSTLVMTQAGRTRRLTLSGLGRLLHEVDYDGTEITRTWDAAEEHLLQKEEVDPLGHRTVTLFNTNCTCPARQPLSITDPLGGVTLFDYDTNGNLTRRTDALGRVTQYQYDGNQKLVAVQDAFGQVTSTIWDAAGRMTSKTDPLGRTTQFNYDPFGQLLTQIDPQGGVTTYEYNPGGFLTRIVSPGRSVTQLFRDAAGRIVAVSDPAGNVTAYAYTPGGLVSQKTDPGGHPTQYTYSMLTPAGAYYELLTRVAKPLTTRDFTYDAGANQTEDSLDAYWFHAYDSEHRRTASWRARGEHGVLVYGYDPVGNLVSVKEVAGPVAFADPTTYPGAVTTYAYDPLRRLVSIVHPDGATITRTYDAVGNLTSQSDPEGHTTTYAYDLLNQLVQQSDPMGRVTTRQYDAVSNLTSEVDPAGHTSLLVYDSLNRVTARSDPLGHVTTFGYSPDGDLTGIRDANGHEWTFQYDVAHRLRQESDPQGNVTTYAYDPDGNPAAVVDAMGRVTLSSYDADERLTAVQYWDGTTTVFEYDAWNQVTRLSSPVYSKTQTWSSGTLTRESYAFGCFGFQVDYEYDDARRRKRISGAMPYNPQIAFDYRYTRDDRGRLSVLTAQVGQGASAIPTLTTSYINGPTGRRTQVSHANGIVTTYAYDPAGQVTRIDHRRSGQTIGFFEYGYDLEGLRMGRLTQAGAESYAYDDAHRLVGAVGPMEAETFAYDAVGNIQGISNASGLRVFAHDASNRLVSEAGTTPATYAHSAVGSLIRRTTANQVTEYGDEYTRNGLAFLTVNGAQIAGYGNHPASDLMLFKDFYQLAGGYVCDAQSIKPRRYTIWDGKNPLLDFHIAAVAGTGNIKLIADAHYVPAEAYDELELILAGNPGAGFFDPLNPPRPHVPLRDALNSVYALTDTTGAVVSTYGYSTYGEPRGWSDPNATLTRFTYTGREWDPDAGMYYYRARWYAPERGRFVSRDRIWPMSGINPYEYVHSSPIDSVDPSGLGRFDDLLAKAQDYGDEIRALTDQIKLSEGAGKAALLERLKRVYSAYKRALELARGAAESERALHAVNLLIEGAEQSIFLISTGRFILVFLYLDIGLDMGLDTGPNTGCTDG